MFFLVSLIGDCVEAKGPKVENKKFNLMARWWLAGIVGDTLISITALAVGILAVVGVLHGIPPAAAYSLIGLSGVITATWIFLTSITKGGIFKISKYILESSLSSNPKDHDFKSK